MAHVLQVGVGSGGMPVLDLVGREASVTSVTLLEPDVYREHNVVRHVFGRSSIGQPKVSLAREWLAERRPDLAVETLSIDLLDPSHAATIEQAAARADLGICAVDNEPAKYHFDDLMRRHGKPWTLGEVLAGGIGGFVHWFVPGGPCYGCVASHLQRTVTTEVARAPDYSQPGGAVAETSIPATKTAIAVIASLHAQVTLQLLRSGPEYDPGFTSLLLPLEKVPGIFAEAFRPHRLRVPRSPECLFCGDRTSPGERKMAAADLDRSLEEALNRLAEP